MGNGLVRNLRAPRELTLAEVGNHPSQPVVASDPSFFSRYGRKLSPNVETPSPRSQ